MQSQSGLFIVLEGSDASGKSTQFQLLKDRLIGAGHDVEVFDFPRYNEPSSHFVRNYLGGKYGPADSINPYAASLFYALDRYEAAPAIRKALADGKVVLSDRYVGANMAHQGSKFAGAIEKRSFFIWEDSIEYQLLNIPRPDVSFFLRVPASISAKLIQKRASSTGVAPDEHEKNLDHLARTVETYDLLCQLFPRDFLAVDCVRNGELLPVEAISQALWDSLQPLLPPLPEKAVLPVPAVPEESVRIPHGQSKASANKSKQSKPKTDYRWKVDGLSYLAAAELKSKLPHLEIADNNWAGPGSDYSFHLPESLSVELAAKYKLALAQLARTHKVLHADLANWLSSIGKTQSVRRAEAAQTSSEILRTVTPLSAHTSISLQIRQEQAHDVLEKIADVQNEEVQRLSRQLADKLGELWPDAKAEIDESISQESAPEAIGSIIEKLTAEMTPRKTKHSDESFKLLECHPRNEFELIADGLSSYSSLPRDDIVNQMNSWNYNQKSEALRVALSRSPNVLERATYRVDCRLDWQAYVKILELPLAGDCQRQLSAAGNGHEVPTVIDEAVLDEAYLGMFKQSQELYSLLQTEHDGRTLEYATLLGHKLHWQITATAADIKSSLRSADTSLTDGIVGLVETVHPTVAKFIKQDKQPQTDSKASPKKPRRSRRRSKKK